MHTQTLTPIAPTASSRVATGVRERTAARRPTVSGLRRWLIYKPLAILTALLLLPVFSWMEGGNSGLSYFQVPAQSIGCNGPNNQIIPGACVNGAMVFAPDLSQLESDAVNAYLAEHSLPASDAHVIYDLGRSDLRNAIRANMMAILLGIINKPAASRSAHEQGLYSLLSNLVQQHEAALYQNALNQYHAWQNNPCYFTLDPVIASTYNLSYDGAAFCASPLNSLFSGPPVPAESYFTAYGMRKSYGAAADSYSYFPALVSRTSVNVGEVAGIAGAAGGVLAAGAGAGLVASFTAATWAFEAGAAALAAGASTSTVGGLASTSSIYLLSSSTVDAFGSATLAAGPAAIILIAIAIGVTAGMQVFSNQQTLEDLDNLQNSLNLVSSTPPDLLALASDSSGLGLYKLEMTLLSLTVPEVASSAALPSHATNDANFQIGSNISPTLTYKDWDGNVWSAETWGGWLVQTCAGANCAQKDSVISSLNYIDGSGVKWTASRMGTKFLSTKAQPASTDAPCIANTITGVSSGSNFSNCSSYVSGSITLADGSGNPVSVSMTAMSAPAFNSASTTLPFTPTVPSTQTITVSGNPAPTVCSSNSTLPANFSLNGGNCGQGAFQLTFDGSATAPEGSYGLTLTATNGTGTTATQSFIIDVSQHLLITSPNTMRGTAGLPVSFLITTTGTPPVQLSVDPQLILNGLTFKDNGNGTATISGVYQSAFSYGCVKLDPNNNYLPCGIIATNSQGSIEQQFTILMDAAPSATIVPPIDTNFIAGIPNQVLLSSTGAITPVSWNLLYWPKTDQPNAPWLTLQDNGNGTATLKGTPPLGTTGAFSTHIGTVAAGAFGSDSYYTVNVVNQPVFTSANTAIFTANSPSSFPVTVNEGTVALNSTLPKGLSFSGGNPGSIDGTAASGTGGQYTISLTDTANGQSTTQSLNLSVYEPPAITSPNTATFMTGTPGSFAVTTTGFPSMSSGPVPSSSLPPASPSQGSGMFFTVTGLPADLKVSNLNAQGFATGSLMIEGTPSSGDAGVHEVQITAQNGVGSTAQQTLTLNVINIAGPAPAGPSACNGNYNGTFNGSLRVSAGQNCAFIGGGVTGSIQVNGGTLALTNTKVAGNVALQGPAAFSIGQGTTIAGNVSIESVASASGMHQICGATVSGNLGISTNATPLEIGSAGESCSGNSFAKNVSILGNTAPVSLYNNLVGKMLSCSGNISIAGNGDQAQGASGQCANF